MVFVSATRPSGPEITITSDTIVIDITKEAKELRGIYEAAKRSDALGIDPGPLLGAAGLDWPPGSGDFHGHNGKHAREMTRDELKAAYVDVATEYIKIVFTDLAEL